MATLATPVGVLKEAVLMKSVDPGLPHYARLQNAHGVAVDHV